jgi:hypothetical protein
MPGGNAKCGSCNHEKRAHKTEPGFYDVRSTVGACTHVGCPCESYRP